MRRLEGSLTLEHPYNLPRPSVNCQSSPISVFPPSLQVLPQNHRDLRSITHCTQKILTRFTQKQSQYVPGFLRLGSNYRQRKKMSLSKEAKTRQKEKQLKKFHTIISQFFEFYVECEFRTSGGGITTTIASKDLEAFMVVTGGVNIDKKAPYWFEWTKPSCHLVPDQIFCKIPLVRLVFNQ